MHLEEFHGIQPPGQCLRRGFTYINAMHARTSYDKINFIHVYETHLCMHSFTFFFQPLKRHTHTNAAAASTSTIGPIFVWPAQPKKPIGYNAKTLTKCQPHCYTWKIVFQGLLVTFFLFLLLPVHDISQVTQAQENVWHHIHIHSDTGRPFASIRVRLRFDFLCLAFLCCSFPGCFLLVCQRWFETPEPHGDIATCPVYEKSYIDMQICG